MKKIIINALIREEVRIAILDGNRLQNIYFDISSFQVKRQNVYKARIVHYEQSLEALFVDFGGGRDGFLPANNLRPGSLPAEYFDENGKLKAGSDNLSNQEILVQVDRDERENKGATLTTELTLAGSYLLIIFGRDSKSVASRTIPPARRKEMVEMLEKLRCPPNSQIIVRNAARNCTAEQIQKDIDHITAIHNAILERAQSMPAPEFIYQDSNIVTKALRDFCRDNVEEIIVDSEEYFEVCSKFLGVCFPNLCEKLHLHDQPEPIFKHYDIEDQVKQLYKRKVRLPSGGEIVIDYTEALTSVDINSSQSTSRDNIEETALDTNLEAMDEVARQIRLRDIGGLIVIDIIDMKDNDAKQRVIDRLNKAVEPDYSYIRIGDISSFHLLEMTRERLMPSVRDTSLDRCRQCSGSGWIPNLTTSVTSLLRDIRHHSTSEKTRHLLIRAHYDLATYVLNHYRSFLDRTLQMADCEVIILPDVSLHAYQYNIETLGAKHSGSYDSERQKASQLPKTQQIEPVALETSLLRREDFMTPGTSTRAVRTLSYNRNRPSWLARLWQSLFGRSGESSQPPGKSRSSRRQSAEGESQGGRQSSSQSRSRQRGRRGGRGQRRGGRGGGGGGG
nr:Rne/Rng family ribonuclease [Pseudomonadota bacterium]